MRTTLWALACAAVVGTTAVAAQTPARPAEPQVVPLHQAVADGLVDVEVTSRGGANGANIVVHVQRKTGGRLRLNIAPGTVFLSIDSKLQNMAGWRVMGEFNAANQTYVPGQVIVLADARRRSYLVEGYCLDFEKPPPKPDDAYRMAMIDVRAARIFSPPRGLKPSQWAVQCAVWMDRAGVSGEQIKHRYRVTDVDVKVGVDVLRHAEQQGIASLPRDLPPEVRGPLEKVFSSDPAVRDDGVAQLSRLGQVAAVAAPFVAVNVVTDRPGVARSTNVNVAVNAQQAAEWLDRIDLPAVRVWAQALRGGPLAGPLLQAPGVTPGIPPPAGAVPPEVRRPLEGRALERAIGNLKARLPLVRRQAAAHLGEAKDARAVEALIDALGDSEANVREAAAGSLKQITGQDHGTDAEKWRAWWAANKQTFGG